MRPRSMSTGFSARPVVVTAGGSEPAATDKIADGTLATWFAAHTGPTVSMTTTAGVTVNTTWLGSNATGTGTSGDPYVVNAKNFTSENVMSAAGKHVKFTNCKVTSGSFFCFFGAAGTYASLTLEDCEFTGASACVTQNDSDVTIRRCDIHDMSQDGLKIGSRALVEWNYIHHIGTGGAGVHADGIQIQGGGGNVVIQKNFINVPFGEVGSTNNSAIIIKSDDSQIDDVQFVNNWANGGNYTFYSVAGNVGPGSAPTNVVCTGNRWGRDYNFGVFSLEGTTTPSSNVWDDDGTPKNS